ncbi:UDP-3-O-acyl-N-acetylglucosamine deacetylase [Aliiroseovarius subalbicans]|uniref:UDP-3-O-acyl-N-acetylglucosamine deacetylase n=1 Tax=Aliiroseovarius subalbicans TaxID=2925840 RepID=UPI001F5966EC|nr:UDP-3-O-acyl-N-acetylglucosamine deacetylase [uncultured Aliiroseovarius sp.]MCI2398153.1 UDP-3-O-acyl-N-acetylglucosamine deacetylase [Aliiroseovarius subalbicans]
MQTTINTSITFSGTGLHSGRPVRMILRPAPAGHGIKFQRVDIRDRDNLLPAHWSLVEQTPLCTRLVNGDGVDLSTVEHIMAALAGCGIRNVLIDVDGPEVPILDGSSARFVAKIVQAGTRRQTGTARLLRIVKPVRVEQGDAWAQLEPADGFEIGFHIDFDDAAIGKQALTLDLSNGAFVRELSDSRTFCRQSDVNAMRDAGLALGGTLENAVVVDGDKVLSPGGLRHVDEPVRHKMLDALGDLYMAGAPILGRYTGHKAGHTLTNKLLRAVFVDDTAWRLEACDAATARKLPGVGVCAADLPMSA